MANIRPIHLIIGAVGLVTLTGATILYLQYRKLMKYKISVKTVRFKSISASAISFDLYLNFLNNSDLQFDIVSQKYEAYINGKKIVNGTNTNKVPILKSATSIVPVAISIDLNKASNVIRSEGGVVSLISSPERFNISVDGSLYVKLYGIKLGIPFHFKSNLRDIIQKKNK